jgi:DNA-binding MarR family transcriptional regulator
MGPNAQVAGEADRSPAWSIGQALFGLATTAVRSVPRDMSLTSLSTLSTLERCGPRRITDLAVTEGVAQPSMTALVSALERSGLVQRRAHASDKRVSLVVLTSAGSAYMHTRRHAGTEAIVELIAELPADEIAALHAASAALLHVQALEEERRDAVNGSPAQRLEGALP